MLFVDGVDQDAADPIVFDAFGFAFIGWGRQQRLDLGHCFGDQTEIGHSAVAPVE